MYDIIINGLGILIFAGTFIFSKGFAVSKREGVPSAAFFPRIIAVVVLVFAVYNLIRFLIKRKKGMYEKPEKMQEGRFVQFMGILLLLFLYAILWDNHIGHFILNTIIVFSPVCWLMSDEKEWWKTALYITCLTFFIYALFVFVLKVRIW